MTVSTQLYYVSFTGGVTPQTVFALPFKFYGADTIYAQLDGVDLTQGVDFTVGGVGENLTGTVTLSVALAQDAVLYVERSVPYLQEVDLQGQGSFLPETHEDALDILEFQIQQLVGKYGILEFLAANLIYDLAANCIGFPPDNSILARWAIARVVTFPQNMTGSQANSEVAADAETVITIKKNGGTVGTITFAAASTTGVFSTGLWFANPGDVVSLHNQAVSDAALTDISVTMIGQRSV